MFYERKIIYLDYLVKGERCKNAGFLKMEAKGRTCNLTINIRNLESVDSDTLQVCLTGGGQESVLCEVKITQGKGVKCLLQQDMHDIAHSGITYETLEAVRIPIGPEKEICGIVREHVSEAEAAEQKGIEPDCMEPNCVEPNCAESDKEQENVLSEQDMPKFPLYDDKWQQLWAIYPHIRPFQDEREYLSVGPNDFVILPYRYFTLVNNSFLLHGYHNYKHLILKKMEYRGRKQYYIGVPGNFYERETQVAVMFGFESFEGLEEPAHTGDYGYYLMRVEL